MPIQIRHAIFVTVCVGVLYTAMANSQSEQSHISKSNVSEFNASQVSTTASSPVKSSTTVSSVENTATVQTIDLQTQALRWGLEVEEYEQYLGLMQGPLGRWSPNIDPLLALGMYAETPQQDQRYAELYARQEFELTQRALHFQQSYRNAFGRLYPNVGLLDQTLLQPYVNHRQEKKAPRSSIDLAKRQFTAGDHLLYFVDSDCSDCKQVLNRLMSLLSGLKNTVVEVYVLAAPTDQAVQAWARTQQINVQWLNQERLSLNRDEGLYTKLKSRSVNPSDTTKLYLHRNDRYFQLSTSDLGL